MAIKRFVIDGYGQLELNNVAFRRDGRIEAQCYLADGIDYVENGMLLAVDNVARKIKMPVADGSDLIALNYTTEHMYDERKPGLKNFKLEKGSFLPRLGYLAAGDKFTSNCICYDDADFANDAAVKAIKLQGEGAVEVYASECANGAILLKKGSKPTGKAVVLKVVAVCDMPDGQFALKFQVL